ncbi:MAG: hypothetical protein HY921_06820 [Elusimicrobia bacterium]|nr:hypothetical protein [Elusimicrobiota bacterium]
MKAHTMLPLRRAAALAALLIWTGSLGLAWARPRKSSGPGRKARAAAVRRKKASHPRPPLQPRAAPRLATRWSRQWLRLGGYVKNKTAYRVARPRDWSQSQNLLYLAVSGDLAKSFSYKASLKAFYDSVYDWRGPYARDVRRDLRLEGGLWEGYLDFSEGNWDARIGKQQIVWGETVGIFAADVVNARDMREFLLQDFGLIRVPQWAVQGEASKGATHLEWVWIPILAFNHFPPQGAEFAPVLPSVQGRPIELAAEQKPKDGFKNSEIGGRLSVLAEGWDLSLFQLYAWDKSLVLSREGAPSPLVAIPLHHRLPLTGATFSKERGGVVYRGEAVYYHGKYFSALDPSVASGLVRRDALEAVLGGNASPWQAFDVNLQVLHRKVFNYGPALFHEEPARFGASLWLKTGLFDDSLEPELLFVSNLKRKDMMLRPKLHYSWGGHWRATLGMDVFEGSRTEPLGQFDSKDRIYAELKYSF